jgi:hypothetical protein
VLAKREKEASYLMATLRSTMLCCSYGGCSSPALSSGRSQNSGMRREVQVALHRPHDGFRAFLASVGNPWATSVLNHSRPTSRRSLTFAKVKQNPLAHGADLVWVQIGLRHAASRREGRFAGVFV